MNHLFKYLRIVISIIAITLVTLSLVCDGETWDKIGGWLTSIQIFPAALAFSLGILLFWAIVTLLFGRLYCSSICPLGTLQDIISWLSRLISHRKTPYRYSPALNKTRYTTLTLVVIGIILGFSAIQVLFDPFSLYSHFAHSILRPIYGLGRCAVASALGTAIALIPILVIGIVASRHGRTFCNTICPVGTALGAISRNSAFHFDINTDKCINCHECEHVCKASCIDLKDHVVDGSRCVNCFNCTDVCPNNAITYTTTRHRLSTPLMQRIKDGISIDTPRPAMDFEAPKSPESFNAKQSLTDNETIS